ncbi:MAG: glycosyltransferase [Oscillospiraceae bacterium]|nr:glycosyltransferase [Oscillospiraceae bacterium]
MNNFMSADMVKKRDCYEFYSQAANNKITGILCSLLDTDNDVTILSSGLTNHKSGKLYKSEHEEYLGADVIYCAVRDFPLINTISSILHIYKEIKRQDLKKKVDHIIFYNYKPEVAWAAYLAKKRLHIPITVEYEDGYSRVSDLRGLKSTIFRKTEDFVSEHVDYAILVNSQLIGKYHVPSVTVRGVVDKDFYTRCREYRKPRNEKFTILYSGGLNKTRGIDVLIETVSMLEVDCRLVITGKGSLNVDDSRIDFRGFVSHEEMQNLMMQADVLVQCQLTNDKFSESSFPSKLFEYIATGNSIISSDLPEIVDFAGEAIKYYHNDDPSDLAARLYEVFMHWKTAETENSNLRLLCDANLPENVGKKITTMWLQ